MIPKVFLPALLSKAVGRLRPPRMAEVPETHGAVSGQGLSLKVRRYLQIRAYRPHLVLMM